MNLGYLRAVQCILTIAILLAKDELLELETARATLVSLGVQPRMPL